MCQWEDHVEPYLEATKSLYKDLVKARKNADTGQIEITTLAYQVRPLETPHHHPPAVCVLLTVAAHRSGEQGRRGHHSTLPERVRPEQLVSDPGGPGPETGHVLLPRRGQHVLGAFKTEPAAQPAGPR